MNNANCAGKRYLAIAPNTGVVHPMSKNKRSEKVIKPKIINFSFSFNFLRFQMAYSRKHSKRILSKNEIIFNLLPGSVGQGRIALLVNDSGMFLTNCTDELSIGVVSIKLIHPGWK